MRKMRLAKREVTDEKELEQIIKDCDVVRIGCQDREGMFIVPMNFGYEYSKEGGLKLYVHSAKEGRKAESFDLEPQVAIEMDSPKQLIVGDFTCNYSMAYTSIMGNGTIKTIVDREEKIKALTLIMKHLDAKAEIILKDNMLEAVRVYCIYVDSFTGKRRPIPENKKIEKK